MVSGLVEEVIGDVTASFVVADGSLAVVVAPVVEELTGSSSCGAVEEPVTGSLFLAGTAGAVSVAVGLVASFLKKFPKMEPLLPAFDAFSRLVAPAAGVVAEVGCILPVTPVTSVPPVVFSVVPVVAGAVSPSVARGAPTTRAAREMSLSR